MKLSDFILLASIASTLCAISNAATIRGRDLPQGITLGIKARPSGGRDAIQGSKKGTTFGSPKAVSQLNEILVSTSTTAENKAIATAAIKKVLALPLKTFGGLEYYIDIGIGTAPSGVAAATITGVLDSGSDLFWVPSSSCTSIACSKRKVFDVKSSSTYRAGPTKWSIQYGTAAASGHTASDVLTLGGMRTNGSVQFGLAESLDDGFQDVVSDCVVGIGAQTVSELGPTFISVLKDAGAISRRMVSIDMNRATSDDKHGDITFGGLARGHSEREYTILHNSAHATTGGPHHWLAQVDSLTVNNQVIASTADLVNATWNGILDSGTAIIFMPYDQVIDFHSAIQGSKYDAEADAYILACDTKATVTFTFGGTPITLHPEDLTRGTRDMAKNECWSSVASVGDLSEEDGKYFMILGTAFLRNAYTFFDVDGQRIGIAPRK